MSRLMSRKSKQQKVLDSMQQSQQAKKSSALNSLIGTTQPQTTVSMSSTASSQSFPPGTLTTASGQTATIQPTTNPYWNPPPNQIVYPQQYPPPPGQFYNPNGPIPFYAEGDLRSELETVNYVLNTYAMDQGVRFYLERRRECLVREIESAAEKARIQIRVDEETEPTLQRVLQLISDIE